MGRLQDKVAIVAGAGSIAEGWSNGKATAVLFAREGAKVFAVDRDLKAAEESCSLIKAEGGECIAHRCDVSIAAEVDDMVAACISAYGRIDVLFNNVGMQVVGGPLDVKEEDWDRLMTVNVKSMYLTCRAVIPHMIVQGGGSIINNSSTAGIRFTYANVAYAVIQRTQEIGVRVALGAQRKQISFLMIRGAAVPLVGGLLVGGAGVAVVGQLLQAFLVDTHPRDPMTLLGVSAMLCTVAFFASVVPARRAARLDPLVALRCE